MRVGVLASHRVPCGIAEYTNRLVEALERRDDIEPVLLALRADGHRSVPEDLDGVEVVDIGTIGLWRDDGVYSLDAERILGLGLEALHVQYQSMLVNQDPLADLATRFDGTAAITFHDNCLLPDFPHDAFDLRFTHRAGVGGGSAEVIPFGIEERPPVVRTFGLGRSRADYLAPICERRGWVFEDVSSHEPIHGGGQAWRSHSDLVDWLRGADAIVLYYDDNPAAGSSQAVRTAMAARRPVFVNDATWFGDLPTQLRQSYSGVSFEKVATLDDLEWALAELFSRPYVEENSWDYVASLLCERYAAVSLARS